MEIKFTQNITSGFSWAEGLDSFFSFKKMAVKRKVSPPLHEANSRQWRKMLGTGTSHQVLPQSQWLCLQQMELATKDKQDTGTGVGPG